MTPRVPPNNFPSWGGGGVKKGLFHCPQTSENFNVDNLATWIICIGLVPGAGAWQLGWFWMDMGLDKQGCGAQQKIRNFNAICRCRLQSAIVCQSIILFAIIIIRDYLQLPMGLVLSCVHGWWPSAILKNVLNFADRREGYPTIVSFTWMSKYVNSGVIL